MLAIFNDLKPFYENNYCQISVREYARMQKISPPHASKVLNNLCKEGLLIKEEDRRYHFFTVNRENSLFKKLQQAYYQQLFSKLVEFLEGEFITPIIILFGSFAKVELNENSDIDLAIFSISKKKISLKTFEKKLGREIQLLIFKDRDDLKNNPELLHNILNGVIIGGSW